MLLSHKRRLRRIASRRPDLRRHVASIIKHADDEEEVPDIGGSGQVLDQVMFDLADELEDVTEEGAEDMKESRRTRRAKRRLHRHRRSAGVGLGLIASVVLSVPKIMEIVGKAINKISKFLRSKIDQTDDPGPNVIGKFLVKIGHKLEDKYVGVLQKALWGLSKTPIINRKLELHDIDEKDLHRLAKILFYAVLVIAAGNAFAAAAGNLSSIVGTIEGVLGSVKSAEIMQAVKSIMS